MMPYVKRDQCQARFMIEGGASSNISTIMVFTIIRGHLCRDSVTASQAGAQCRPALTVCVRFTIGGSQWRLFWRLMRVEGHGR